MLCEHVVFGRHQIDDGLDGGVRGLGRHDRADADDDSKPRGGIDTQGEPKHNGGNGEAGVYAHVALLKGERDALGCAFESMRERLGHLMLSPHERPRAVHLAEDGKLEPLFARPTAKKLRLARLHDLGLVVFDMVVAA